MSLSMLELGFVDLMLAALAGIGVGFLSGLFGVGGGFLVVPVLNIVLKIPMNIAVGTGACQVLGPATTSLLARRITRAHLRLPVTVAGGLLVGVVAGASLLKRTEHVGDVQLLHRSVPVAEIVVLATYFLLLLGVGLFALWEVRRHRRGRPLERTGWMAGWRIPPYAAFEEFDRPRVSIPALCWFGLGVGFFAGLLGMSGGLILVLGLIYLLGMRTHAAVLSSLVIVWIVAAQATIAHAWNGYVNLALVMALLVGGTIGARLGSDLSNKLGGRQLRHGFGWLLLATAAVIAARLLWLTLT